MERTGIDPGAVEDVDLRLRRHRRRPGRRHRPHLLAGRRAARARARHHRRPPVRLGPAGRPLRRPGGDGRRERRRRRRRRAADVDDPDQLGHDPRRPTSASTTRSPASPGWVKRYGAGEVSQFTQRRDDRREVGLLPRRHGGLRGRVATSGPSGPRPRAASRPRSPRSTGSTTTRGPASRTGRRSARCRTLVEGGRVTAAVASQISDASASLLIVSEQAREGPRPHAAGPHPPHERARRRPDLHADRADPGHPVRASRRPA